jgi:chromosome partitioning protein
VAVIDGAAQVAEMLGACVAVADAVVIPVQPSPADVWGASTVVQLVRRTRTPAAFVVSQARAGTNLASEIGDALDGYGLPILRTPDGAPARTCQRVAYPTAMLQGRTVLDTAPKGKAAAEVQAIADAVAAFLEQATGDATSPTNPNE